MHTFTAEPTRSIANRKPSLHAGLTLVLTVLLTLSACSPAGPAAPNIEVSSPTVAPQGQLSLNAIATFTVTVLDADGLYQADDLRYHWALDEERGTYLLDGGDEATEAVTTSASLRVRGDRAGPETVRVKVVDTSSDTTIGIGTLAFDITTSSATSTCFKAPTLLVAYSYPPYLSTDAINIETGERTYLSGALITDASSDGNWLAGVQSAGEGQTQVFIMRCDGTQLKFLTSGEHYEESPTFSPDGQSIYFGRRSADENVLYPGKGYGGYQELTVVDIATGTIRRLTNLNAKAQGAQHFAVSPDGEKIAFQLLMAKVGGPGVTYEYDYELVTMPSAGGPLNSLTYLGDYVPLYGIDWSPDGSDIIFSWDAGGQTAPRGESGIYRIHPTAGSEPQLIFADPSEESLPPRGVAYYAAGTRIAWSGQEYGQSTREVWSIDANGADVRQLTYDVGSARLLAVWDPY